MDSNDLSKLGLAGLFAASLLWMLRWYFAQQLTSMGKMADAITTLGTTLAAHAVDEANHHAMVRESIADLKGEINGAADERARNGLTPVEGVPVPRTPTRAASEPGIYGLRQGRKL